MTRQANATSRGGVAGWPLVAVSLSFGLGAGLLEVFILAVRRTWFEPTLFESRQFVWTVPLVTCVLCSALGVGLFLAARVLPRQPRASTGVLPMAFLAFLGPCLAFPRLHPAAALALAAGLAAQTTRVAERNAGRALAIGSRAVPWLLALVAGLGIGVNVKQSLDERRALAALPAPRASAPNVLLVVLDTVRSQSLSLYGYPKPTTPELERLAAAGVVFDTAFATAPWTLPSHSSMFTGRLPHELSASWATALDSTYPTLAETLQARGYTTAGFVANLVYGASAFGLARGFIHYEDFPVSVGQALVSSSLGAVVTTSSRLRNRLEYHRVAGRKTAAEVNAAFVQWLSRSGGRPFFAFLNYMDAHEPYLPPTPFDAKFGPPRGHAVYSHSPQDAFRVDKWATSSQEAEAERSEYEGAIAYIDHELGKLLDSLKAQGVLERTVVIVTSDHGEHLGEHRLFGHGNSLYRAVLGVPLVVAFPGRVPPGLRIHAPVSLRDLPATVMELVDAGAPHPFPGSPLSRFWQQPAGSASPDAVVISEAERRTFGVQQPWYPLNKGGMQSVIAQGYHYIRNDNGDEELYDMDQDAAETRDLARSDAGERVIGTMRQRLEAARTGSGTHMKRRQRR